MPDRLKSWNLYDNPWCKYWQPHLDANPIGTVWVFDAPYGRQRIVDVYTVSTQIGRPAKEGEVWFAWFEPAEPGGQPIGHAVSLDEWVDSDS